MIAALVFSGIKAKGSDGETEAVGQAETTVMSASELEKYLGYEKENTVSDSTAEKNSTTKKKSSSKKSSKKTAAKKSSGTRTVSESAKSNAGAAGQGTTQTPVASVPADGYKDGTYEGSGIGFGGTIRVRVTISGGKIAAIDILEASGETASYFCVSSGCDQQDDCRKYTECRCSKWSNLFLQRNHPGSSECPLPGSGRWKQPAGHPYTCSNCFTNSDISSVTY